MKPQRNASQRTRRTQGERRELSHTRMLDAAVTL
ncbi:MAG: hypothetical protein JWM69_409, partial [Candidatus Binatus sp.]|nr:hypothetical protein [Candidatus Binatus sp.]